MTTAARPLTEGVTVVLTHTATEPVTAELLDAVSRSMPIPGGIETVVVDADESRGPRPWEGRAVVVVGSGPDEERASLRNRGATMASTAFVAFLSTGVRPRSAWLVRAVELFQASRGTACVAPAIDDSPSPVISFTGLRGDQSRQATSPGPVDVLHPAAEASVFDLEAFRLLGGFDHHFGRDGEEVDIGWRAWIHGYRVIACPGSIIDRAVPPLPEDPSRRERNALCTIFKNYGDGVLQAALPATTSVLAGRTRNTGASREVSTAKALQEFHRLLPAMVLARKEVQARRKRPDGEIFHLFGTPLEPAAGDLHLREVYDTAIDAFALHIWFGSRHRILVITPDVLTWKMAGPAIRAWQIATALAAEHEVALVTTTDLCEITSPHFRVGTVTDAELSELEDWCDAMILQGFVLESRPLLRDTDKVVIADIYDPLHLEQLELARHEPAAYRHETVEIATKVLNDQLRRGDFFLCASSKQRDFWLGQMAGMGRINPLTYDEDETIGKLITIVPFGLPDAAPVRTAPSLKGVVPGIGLDDEVILWGGGIYNWFDPLTLIRAVDRLRHRRPNVRLFFMGLKHPNPHVAEMRMASASRLLAANLGLTDVHVFFNEGWVAYENRQNFLLEADVGVSTHLDHIETEFSFRTRLLDYIWAGLPIVATSGDAFGGLIESEMLGLTVPASDVEQLEEALFRVLDDREFAATCKKNLEAIRHRFTWSSVLQPLIEFCRAPRRAPDLIAPSPLRSEIADIERGSSHLIRDGLVGLVRNYREGGPEQVARQTVARLRVALGPR